MKNTFDRIKLAFLGAIVCISAAASANAQGQTNLSYVTAKEITAMAPCTAIFAKRLSEYSGSFTNAEGKRFVLGDEHGGQWVWHFVGALKEGQAYKFPDAFVNYQAAPHYVTAKDILAMAPRIGTLASRTPCSSYFSTADGKWFGIGDPGSGPQVSRFIWSLKDGETCKFPEAFLKFQTNLPPMKP
jgi:hypothetical protein